MISHSPLREENACNCWFNSKPWNLCPHKVSLFDSSAALLPSHSLFSQLGVSRQDQARTGGLRGPKGRRLHQLTHTLHFTPGLRPQCCFLLPVFQRVSDFLLSLETVIPTKTGVKDLPTSDPSLLLKPGGWKSQPHTPPSTKLTCEHCCTCWCLECVMGMTLSSHQIQAQYLEMYLS